MLFKTIVILWILFILFLLLVLLPLWFDLEFSNNGYNNVLFSSIWVWLPIFLVQMYLLFLVTYKEQHKNNTLKFAIISLILPLIWYWIFNISNRDYVYDNSPSSNYYADSNSLYVEDIDEYKKYLDKYGFSWQKTYFLNSIEDHINVLEFAKNELWSESLYEATTHSAFWYWITDILKEYNNKTFEAYFYKIATNRISNVHYNITNPGESDYYWNFLMHDWWPFEQWLRYIANNSNYEDIKEESKKIINAYDYYKNNRTDPKATSKVESELWFRWWFQYWDDIETWAEDFWESIEWLEHNWKTYWIDYWTYQRVKSRLWK